MVQLIFGHKISSDKGANFVIFYAMTWINPDESIHYGSLIRLMCLMVRRSYTFAYRSENVWCDYFNGTPYINYKYQ